MAALSHVSGMDEATRTSRRCRTELGQGRVLPCHGLGDSLGGTGLVHRQSH